LQIHAPDILKAYHRKHPLERIKAASVRRVEPISSHWTALSIHPLPSSTLSDCTDTFLRHALLNNWLSTTPTRNSTISGLLTQSRIKHSSTVLAFPCRPLHVCSSVSP
jgi:hypothetical protein